MVRPELCLPARAYQPVVLVIKRCSLERHKAGVHGEKDNSQGEKVRQDGLIDDLQCDFGSHVAYGAHLLVLLAEPLALVAADIASQAEID